MFWDWQPCSDIQYHMKNTPDKTAIKVHSIFLRAVILQSLHCLLYLVTPHFKKASPFCYMYLPPHFTFIKKCLGFCPFGCGLNNATFCLWTYILNFNSRTQGQSQWTALLYLRNWVSIHRELSRWFPIQKTVNTSKWGWLYQNTKTWIGFLLKGKTESKYNYTDISSNTAIYNLRSAFTLA